MSSRLPPKPLPSPGLPPEAPAADAAGGATPIGQRPPAPKTNPGQEAQSAAMRGSRGQGTGRPSRILPRSRVSIGPAGAPSVDDIEKLEAIREVMEYAARVTQAVALAKPMQSFRARPIVLAVLAALSLALTAYTYIAEPDWAFGPAPVASHETREAHLKFAMYLLAQRIEAGRDSITGAPPASLSDVGEEWAGVSYSPRESTFELRARDPDGKTITLASDQDLHAFLGSSREALRGLRK